MDLETFQSRVLEILDTIGQEPSPKVRWAIFASLCRMAVCEGFVTCPLRKPTAAPTPGPHGSPATDTAAGQAHPNQKRGCVEGVS